MKSRLGKTEGITATAHTFGRTGNIHEEKAVPREAGESSKQFCQLGKIAESLGFQVTQIPLVIVDWPNSFNFNEEIQVNLAPSSASCCLRPAQIQSAGTASAGMVAA